MLICVIIPKDGGWNVKTPDLPAAGLWYRELQDAIDYARTEDPIQARRLLVFDAKGEIVLTQEFGGIQSASGAETAGGS